MSSQDGKMLWAIDFMGQYDARIYNGESMKTLHSTEILFTVFLEAVMPILLQLTGIQENNLEK